MARSVGELVTSDFSDYIPKRNKVTSDFSDYRVKKESYEDLGNTKRDRSRYTENAARSKATYLAQKLENPSRWLFYLKCAWNLTDRFLDWLLGIALTKEEPKLYFSAMASREMRKNA